MKTEQGCCLSGGITRTLASSATGRDFQAWLIDINESLAFAVHSGHSDWQTWPHDLSQAIWSISHVCGKLRERMLSLPTEQEGWVCMARLAAISQSSLRKEQTRRSGNKTLEERNQNLVLGLQTLTQISPEASLSLNFSLDVSHKINLKLEWAWFSITWN